MNKSIRRLERAASKKSRIIVGLMSGTSMDGLDVALCKLTNDGLRTRFKLLQFETVGYSREVKDRIAEVFAKEKVNFERLCILHPWLGMLHGRMVLQCLKKWKFSPARVDAIASHGQTVMHSPAFHHPGENINATLQIGDGDHMAVVTGILTVSDFRQKHIAMGGEGAPLAVYGDYLLLSDKRENRILLNMGGIANFTYLPAGQNASKVFVTDTGPGNTLIDQTIRHYFPGEYFDKDASRALRGRIHERLLSEMMSEPFFRMPFPKTTGPELFNMDFVRRCQERAGAAALSPEDLLATLTRFSSDTITLSIKKAVRKDPFSIYLSGGGAHNPLLTRHLQESLQLSEVRTTVDLGVPPDAKEAILFAVLANETLAGGHVDFGRRTRIPSACMGKISFPE